MQTYRKTTFFYRLIRFWYAALLVLVFSISNVHAEDNDGTQRNRTTSSNGVTEEKEISLTQSEDGSLVQEKKEKITSPKSRWGESDSTTTTTATKSAAGKITNSVNTETESTGILGMGKRTESNKQTTEYKHGGRLEETIIDEEKNTGTYRRKSDSTVTKINSPDGITKTKTETKTTVSKQGLSGAFGHIKDTTDLIKVEHQQGNTKRSESRSTTQHSLGQGETVKEEHSNTRTKQLGEGKKLEGTISRDKTTKTGSIYNSHSESKTAKVVSTTEQSTPVDDNADQSEKIVTKTTKTVQQKVEEKKTKVLGVTLDSNNQRTNSSKTETVVTNPDKSTVTTTTSLTTTKGTNRRSISGTYSSEYNKNTKKGIATTPQEKPKGPSTKVKLAGGSVDLGLVEKKEGTKLVDAYGNKKEDGLSYSAVSNKQESTGSYSATIEEGKLKAGANLVISNKVLDSEIQAKKTVKGPGNSKAVGKLSGALQLGSEGKLQGNMEVGPDGAKVNVGGGAFVGLKVNLKAELEADFKETMLGFGVKGTGTAGVTAGAGGEGNADFEISAGKIKFGGKFNAAFGIGGNAGTGVEVDLTPWYHWAWPNEMPVNKATQLFADLSKKAKENGEPFPPVGVTAKDVRDQIAKGLGKLGKNKDGKPVNPVDYFASQYGIGPEEGKPPLNVPQQPKPHSDSAGSTETPTNTNQDDNQAMSPEDEQELADLFEALLDDMMANDPDFADNQASPPGNKDNASQPGSSATTNTAAANDAGGWNQQDMETAMQTDVNSGVINNSQGGWGNGPAAATATQNERSAASQTNHDSQMAHIDSQAQQLDDAIRTSQSEHDSSMQDMQTDQQARTEWRDAIAGGIAGGLADGVSTGAAVLGQSAADDITGNTGGCSGCGGENHPHPPAAGQSSVAGTQGRTTSAQGAQQSGQLTPECIRSQNIGIELASLAKQIQAGNKSLYPRYEQLARSSQSSIGACMNSLPPSQRSTVKDIYRQHGIDPSALGIQ